MIKHGINIASNVLDESRNWTSFTINRPVRILDANYQAIQINPALSCVRPTVDRPASVDDREIRTTGIGLRHIISAHQLGNHIIPIRRDMYRRVVGITQCCI